eukprot:TRINITY_DN35624_c0_g3_i3.p1 TRINITY_DN35624_c0_g3~~TRINITY_DN35624_c0_g3_i3.p1  ORF type:complete len:110 (-),score=19.44 TRINITY_DN35624_c0_g3_i3:1136-1465(-)
MREREDKATEEVGEDYMLELIHRSMIQVGQLNFNGTITECRIHDSLLDLTIKEAKEDMFLRVHQNVDFSPQSVAHRFFITHHLFNLRDSYLKKNLNNQKPCGQINLVKV